MKKAVFLLGAIALLSCKQTTTNKPTQDTARDTIVVSAETTMNIEHIMPTNDSILSYIVDTKKQELRLYWKNDTGAIIGTFDNLKTFVESKQETLVFAMNAGMYKTDFSPLGLFIENQKTIHSINNKNASSGGNFYLKPNGVFLITTDNVPEIVCSANFKNDNKIKYATQSGPMLVIDGKIHSAFKKGSTNLNIRNGVGILSNGKVIFAMSRQGINFYDFALYFQELGCKNALYLDGVISKTYLPEQNLIQTGGSFGVIIGVTK
jgi:uncharacterized protein YigE (DUF2233 family)